TSESEARSLYRRNYSADWDGIMSVKAFTMPEFKLWLKAGNKSKPAGSPSRSQRMTQRKQKMEAKNAEPLQSETPRMEPRSATAQPEPAPPITEAAPTSEPFALSPPEVRTATPKTEDRQTSIDLPPPTVGERPIIGRETTPEESPLFSKAAQEREVEQVDLTELPEVDNSVPPQQPAQSNALTIDKIPADLTITLSVDIEQTGETRQVEVNARKAWKQARQKVNRLTKLLECVG
ncbi:MAG: hypothetical protein ACRCZI_10960, partial [Cetobacterium sp.]